MSRTKRHIPHWARVENAGKSKFRNSLLGIGRDFYRVGQGLPDGAIDPRSRHHHGYDGLQQSRLVEGLRGWPEHHGPKTRIYWKRAYHKAVRRKYKTADWLSEY